MRPNLPRASGLHGNTTECASAPGPLTSNRQAHQGTGGSREEYAGWAWDTQPDLTLMKNFGLVTAQLQGPRIFTLVSHTRRTAA